MRHKQYYVNNKGTEGLTFVSVRSNSADGIEVTLPDGFVAISIKAYYKLKWGERKMRLLSKQSRIKEKAMRIKNVIIE